MKVQLDTRTKLKLSLVNKELENMNTVKMNVVTNTRDISDMKLSNPNTASSTLSEALKTIVVQ